MALPRDASAFGFDRTAFEVGDAGAILTKAQRRRLWISPVAFPRAAPCTEADATHPPATDRPGTATAS